MPVRARPRCCERRRDLHHVRQPGWCTHALTVLTLACVFLVMQRSHLAPCVLGQLWRQFQLRLARRPELVLAHRPSRADGAERKVLPKEGYPC